MLRRMYHMKWLVLLFFSLIGLESFSQEEDYIDTVTSVIESTDGVGTEHNFDSFSVHIPPIVARKIPDSMVNRFKNHEDYWYANLPPQKKKEPKQEDNKAPLARGSWADTLIWIVLIGGFIALLVWYLTSSNIRLFRKKTALINGTEEKELSEDIFEIPYEKEIRSAIASQNYRLATRLMYLRTLRELADRQLIQFRQEKTNSDYLFQLHNTKYYRDFFRLTRDFEYTWYGKFQLSPEAFSIVEKDFTNFKQQLS